MCSGKQSHNLDAKEKRMSSHDNATPTAIESKLVTGHLVSRSFNGVGKTDKPYQPTQVITPC